MVKKRHMRQKSLSLVYSCTFDVDNQIRVSSFIGSRKVIYLKWEVVRFLIILVHVGIKLYLIESMTDTLI